jgi:hypothetical protein
MVKLDLQKAKTIFYQKLYPRKSSIIDQYLYGDTYLLFNIRSTFMKHTAHIFSPSSLHYFGLPSFSSPLFSRPPVQDCVYQTKSIQSPTVQCHSKLIQNRHRLSFNITAPLHAITQPITEHELRLHIIPALLCLFLVTTAHAEKQITKAISYNSNSQRESEPAKAGIAENVADRVTDMVNSVINIARDPRNPHNLAFNITNALANIVHIVLLAKENKSLRSKLDSSSDTGLDKIDGQAETIAHEIEQAIHAYLNTLDPELKDQIKDHIISLITRRLTID